MDRIASWALCLGLFLAGIAALTAPEFMFTAVLDLAVFYLFFTGAFRLVRFFTSGRTRKADLVYGLSALAFGFVLLFYGPLPEWIIRVSFGAYCAFIALCMFMQVLINLNNKVSSWLITALIATAYMIISFLTLFTVSVPTSLLMNLVGVYFILLAFRFWDDLKTSRSRKYSWKRRIHISLPTVIATLLPDYTVRKINEYFQEGREYMPSASRKDNEPVKLKAMVHIGPEGFQKVGHFTFAWKGIVYSYGNYDADSGRLFGMLGDGTYFTVPFEKYIPNIIEYEHNTIFEYGIRTTQEQEEKIEAMLEDLKNNSYRWYCKLEKTGAAQEPGDLESDYPCRLHYRTGAKFFKIKKGNFHTYWAGGDNCVLFADQFLGVVGSDVLSVRGIITPGAYFDYLQSEYAKENSPVVECIVHPWRKEGI